MKKPLMPLLFGMFILLFLVATAKAWYGSFDYRYEINSNATSVIPISVNDTAGVNGTIYWTLNASSGDHTYLYCQNSGCGTGNITIANETDELCYENEDTRGGNCPTSVWEGLGGVWHFGEKSGTTAYDSSANNNTMTLNEADYKSDGRLGYAIGLGGNSTSYGYVPDSESLRVTNSTIMAWIISQGIGSGVQYVVRKWGTDGCVGTECGYWMSIYQSGRLRCIYGDGNGNAYTTTDFTSLQMSNNVWYLITCVKNATHVVSYINGVENESVSMESNVATNNVSVCIGQDAFGDCSSGSQSYSGYIDEIRIYDRALTEDEILQVYYNGVDNHLTFLGTEETTTTTTTTAPPTTTTIPAPPPTLLSMIPFVISAMLILWLVAFIIGTDIKNGTELVERMIAMFIILIFTIYIISLLV